MEFRKKEAELIALQYQINPHFLFNTFTSIKFLMKLGETDKAIEMLTTLGRLFQQAKVSEQIIPLCAELDYVRAYLTIEQIRFNNRLEIRWKTDADLDGCKVPKFILQPVVENALRHGIEVADRKPVVEIRCQRSNSGLCLEVTDNGSGMSEEQLEEVRARVTDTQSSGGIGLRNVDERIRLYFGDMYGLHIESKWQVGTTVRITLPALEKE
jgi:two-component system sensor histidine kinase YesM